MPIGPEFLDRFARDWLVLTRSRCHQRTLVAVSGGADSVALLLLMRAYLGDNCVAATVDHGLRETSTAEAAGVASLCATRGIAHSTLSGPLPERVGRTANVSARARELRYSLLRRHAIEADADWIATAHHADDQLETMVMRLNRGAGIGGLAGIRRWDHSGSLSSTVVRPLLGWRHQELAALVAGEGIVPVDDPSNSDDRFDRARLRKLLARAEWLDPVAAARSAAALGDAEEAIQWIVERERHESCQFGDGQAILRLTNGPAELRRRLVEICLRHVDPTIAPRGREIDHLIEKLESLGPATLGHVRCGHSMYRANDLSLIAWTFQVAPVRRTS